MKVVKFLGGLGNQMFQYAFYLALKKQFKAVKADLSGFEEYDLHNGFELEKIFGISVKKASSFELRLYQSDKRDWLTRKLRKIYGTKNAEYYEKQEFEYDPGIFHDPFPRYFWGYWQHHFYHQEIDQVLNQVFRFKEGLEGENLRISQEIDSSASVSIHIRRGDYQGHPVLENIYEKKYYRHAVKIINEMVPHPRFVVFSDDIPWCKSNFRLEGAVYVDGNKGKKSYLDMQLMSRCKHHIIANSSFSWWGAKINPKQTKIVVAPKTWVKDPFIDTSGLILPNWISI